MTLEIRIRSSSQLHGKTPQCAIIQSQHLSQFLCVTGFYLHDCVDYWISNYQRAQAERHRGYS